MKNQIKWLKILPFTIAFKLMCFSLLRKLFRIPVIFSFSQGGEDIIQTYIQLPKEGVYVDVGCNEAIRYSNTFNLYLQGWTGINIDANKDVIKKVSKIRKKDFSICAAVSDAEREVVFHKSENSCVSTIDEEKLLDWKKHWLFKESDQEKITTRTLTSILDEYLPFDGNIDLLSIDVEGHDVSVLKGLDFSRYNPKLIIVEIPTIQNIQDNPICQYLQQKGYFLKYYAVLNAYFVKK